MKEAPMTTEPLKIDPLDSLVAVAWGLLKTGKTTLGLSWPTPMVHFDFDLGLHRAEPMFVQAGFKILKVPSDVPLEGNIDPSYHIISKQFPMPVKWGPTLQGYMNLWNLLLMDFKAAYEHPQVRSLIGDTGGSMWAIRTRAQLEKAQMSNPTRTRLQQIEYGEPNTDMAAVLGACRAYKKNLLMLHHVGGLYEPKLTSHGVEEVRIGDTYDGWSKSGNLVDVVMKTYKENGSTGIEFIDCGLTLAAEGTKLNPATFTSILDDLNRLRGVIA